MAPVAMLCHTQATPAYPRLLGSPLSNIARHPSVEVLPPSNMARKYSKAMLDACTPACKQSPHCRLVSSDARPGCGRSPPPLQNVTQVPGTNAAPYPNLLGRKAFPPPVAIQKGASNACCAVEQSPGTPPPPLLPIICENKPEEPASPPPTLIPVFGCTAVCSCGSSIDPDSSFCHNCGAIACQVSEPSACQVSLFPCIPLGADLRDKVEQCYKTVAGAGTLDISGVRKVRDTLMNMFGLPKIAFGNMETQMLRFDLDGDGRLDGHEMWLCVHTNLFEYTKQPDHHSHDLAVPHCSPGGAGYEIGKELGHGNQGHAHLGKSPSGELCCIKTYEKKHMGRADIDGLHDEYIVLRSLNRHPDVAFALDIFQDDNAYYMVQELYEGGDFTTLVHRGSRANVHMDEYWWRGVFKQCFMGLAHVHANGLVHCDIKEPNLMLKTSNFKQPHVVIIDFGLVRTAANNAPTVCGTLGYIAPETWVTGKMYPRGDVFAMGVVIMQMLLDRVPPHHSPPPCGVLMGGIFTDGAKDMQDVQTATCVRNPPFILLSARFPLLAKLAERVLEKDASRRPCAKQVLRHWILDCDWSKP